MLMRFIISVTLLIGISGCLPPSTISIPLVDPAQAADGKAFVGSYITPDNADRNRPIHIELAGKNFPANFLKVIWVVDHPDKGIGSIEWPLFICELDDSMIVHLPSLPTKVSAENAKDRYWTKPWEEYEISGYLIYKLKRTTNGFTLAPMNHAFWAKHIESGKLKGTVYQHKSPQEAVTVSVSSPREELKAFLSQYPDQAFEGLEVARFFKLPARLREGRTP